MASRHLLLAFLFLCSSAAVAAAAESVYMYLEGKTYAVQINGVFNRLCGGKSVQVLSQALDGDPDRPKRGGPKIGTDGETYPLAMVKKGLTLGTVVLVSRDPNSFQKIELRGARVADAFVRNNGSWTMTVDWTGGCQGLAK